MTTLVKATRHAKGGHQRLIDELLRRRYLRKGPDGGVIETPGEMFGRVARVAAAPEVGYGASPADVAALAAKFRRLMETGEFLPNSPTLMNAGRPEAMLSACFVIPVEDSLDGIFRAIHQTALVQKAGGGTGFAFDTLRPAGDLVGSSGGTTSGPLSFMKVFSEATAAIQQGAMRRGANMGMLAIDHPDILRFITAKKDPSTLSNFNLSVKVTEDFMERLQTAPGSPHVVVNPRTGARYCLPRGIGFGRYTIQDLMPADGDTSGCLTVKDVWDLLVMFAWAGGEPGLCFIDRVNADNPTPNVGPIRATNPCGEQPLLDYEACNLGSINLAAFVDRDRREIEWDRFAVAVDLAVRFLDNVIDANHYPLDATREISLANRKIGLGLMGFADALVLLGIRYDSDEALAVAREVAESLSEDAHGASRRLAAERGPFPNWASSVWDIRDSQPMRNAACTTIAPTGSISLLAGCSSGIEPVFSLAGRRRALDGETFVSVHPPLEELGVTQGWMDDRAVAALLDGTPPAEIEGLPPDLAEVLVTAHEISAEWHVRMQAAFQEHIDNAISKTVNLPGNAGSSDVDRIFRSAYRLGCKGITVYRDGSRKGQTLSRSPGPRRKPTAPAAEPRARVRVTGGRTFKYRMGCGTLFVTLNRDEAGLCEVFANLGKAGGCPSQSEATCRAVSVALRSGVTPETLIEQLKGIRCLSTSVARKGNDEVTVLSCPDAIARAIEESLAETAGPADPAPNGRVCPVCGHRMRREAGCFVCDRCQFSSCG